MKLKITASFCFSKQVSHTEYYHNTAHCGCSLLFLMPFGAYIKYSLPKFQLS